MTKKLFEYNLVGYVEIEAESEEEANKELWNMSLMDANIEVDSLEIVEAEQ